MMVEDLRIWRAAPGLDIPQSALKAFTSVCVKNSKYEFVSGGYGGNYVDIDELFVSGSGMNDDLRPIVEWTQRRIELVRESERFDLLAFLETRRGPVGVVTAGLTISQAVGMPSMVVRPYKRLLSQAAKPFPVPRDARVLIVADVATTGRNISEAAQVLWRLGARRCSALAIADRQEGAEEFLGTLDIPLHTIVLPPLPDAA